METLDTKPNAVTLLERMEKEVYQEQDAVLSRLLPILSLSSRAEIISLAQKLKENEEEARRFKEVLYYFNKLNQEGQQLFLKYLEVMAANPKFGKKVNL